MLIWRERRTAKFPAKLRVALYYVVFSRKSPSFMCQPALNSDVNATLMLPVAADFAKVGLAMTPSVWMAVNVEESSEVDSGSLMDVCLTPMQTGSRISFTSTD